MPAAVAPGPETRTTDKEAADVAEPAADADASDAADPADPASAAPDPVDLAPAPRRDSITAFEVRVLVHEMQCLVGGFVDKAYQPTRQEVLLRFRAPEVGRRDLFYERGKFLCFTEQRPENPPKPPGFAMALRKHLGGGRVFKVEQVGFDRVVVVWVQRRDGEYRIVFELFGDGNCVIVRPDGKILVPLVPESWAHRTIRSGAPYQPPPARADPWTFDEAAFVAHAREGNRDLVRALALAAGLGGAPAEEVVARAGLAKGTPIEAVTDEDLRRAFHEWDGLRREVESGDAQAGVVLEGGRPVDATAIASRVVDAEVAASSKLELRPTLSFSAALDTLFLSGRRTQEHAERVVAAESQLTKLERQLRAQEAAVEKFEKEVRVKALHGEVLFAHYQDVEHIRQQLLDARKQHDWKGIQERVEAGRSAGNPMAERIARIDSDKGVVVLRLDDVEGNTHEIPIDIRVGVTENANAAYERSKTARNKLAGAKEALAGTMERMSRATEDRDSAGAAVEEAMQRTTEAVGTSRHHWFEAFRWCYSADGALIVAGRDAAGNDRLVKKHLEEGDRYVHADLHGAPSTVVKAAGEPSEEALETAGRLAVTCSRSFGRAGSGDAYWVTPPQVSKTPQAGEFLSRGAFIVRGERHYMRKLPLVWSVGVVWLDRAGQPTDAPDDPATATDRHAKLMGGPPDAVHAHTDHWVDLEAGPEPQRDVVKRLSRAFSAHPDAVARALPTGDLRVVGQKGVKVPAAEGAA